MGRLYGGRPFDFAQGGLSPARIEVRKGAELWPAERARVSALHGSKAQIAANS